MPSHKFFDRFIMLGGSSVDLDALNKKLSALEEMSDKLSKSGILDNTSNSPTPLDKFVKRSQVSDTLELSKQVKDQLVVHNMYGVDLIELDGKTYVNADIIMRLINSLYVDISELKTNQCKVR